jgi:hypothetical protein
MQLHELAKFQSKAFAGQHCLFLMIARPRMIELIESA